MNDRAGKYIRQPDGYDAFSPNPLPPKPNIEWDDELHSLLSEADRAVARLDGIFTVLPKNDLFIAMYVKKEALLSSQIEGTRASLEGVLEFEADLKPKGEIREVTEVINYINALNYGIYQLKEDFPLSLRLIKIIHKELIQGTRGDLSNIGEFRKVQNWIGKKGASIYEADFIPPPISIVPNAMSDLEKFLHLKDKIPPLIRIALIHAQFETIHPFADGNGRIGRLLITFYLFWKGILSKPLLYMSFYLKKHRDEYYYLLMSIRDNGDWEKWIKFFLKGVIEVSRESANTAKEIIQLRDNLKDLLYEKNVSSKYSSKLIDLIFEHPILSIINASKKLNVQHFTLNEIFKKFEKIGILKEITGKKRNKKYMFIDYVAIIAKGTTN